MKIKYIAPLLLVCTSLFGCASAPKLTETDIDPANIEIRKLVDVSNKYHIVNLDEDFCSKWSGPMNSNITTCLLKGDYLLYRESDQGYFFIGLKSQSLTIGPSVMGTTYYLRDGGVWVPKNHLHSPHFFSFFGGESTNIITLSEAEWRTKFEKEPMSPFVRAYVYNKLSTTQKQSTSYFRAINPIPNSLSPMQSGAAGAISGAIVGAILAANLGDDNVPLPSIYALWPLGERKALDEFHQKIEATFTKKIRPIEQ